MRILTKIRHLELLSNSDYCNPEFRSPRQSHNLVQNNALHLYVVSTKRRDVKSEGNIEKVPFHDASFRKPYS